LFIGHFAVGFASKKIAPRLPLGTAFVAAQLPDVIWPALVLAGVEKVAIAPGDTAFTPLRFESYPYSHSLLLGAVWGALFGLGYWLLRRDRRGALVIPALVVSHWVLDVVSHRPDVPVVPWGHYVLGLGLWNSVAATVVVEGALFVLGVAVYASATGGWRRRGSLALGVLAATLAAIYVSNIVGPPPPSVTAVGVVGLVAAPVFWVWGNWVDRRRASAA
jgi:membrane-bound metal-dependent hydrolase YbcI (DUF457 family)